MHELLEDSFRLLRINGRATNLAVIVAIQPCSRDMEESVIAKPNKIRSARINPPLIFKAAHHIVYRKEKPRPGGDRGLRTEGGVSGVRGQVFQPVPVLSYVPSPRKRWKPVL